MKRALLVMGEPSSYGASLLVVLGLLAAAPVLAQNANQAQLRLVVVDQTGAGIPNATVVVTPVSGEPITVMSDDRGVATLPPLATGRGEGARGVSGFRGVRFIAHAAPRRHQPDHHARHCRRAGGSGRQRHRRRARRPQRQRADDDARTVGDRRPARRPGRARRGAAADDRRLGRDLPGERLPRRPPAFARRDPPDPLPHQLVLRRQPRRRPHPDRDHHAAQRPGVERQRQHGPAERRAERPQRVRRIRDARAVSPLQHVAARADRGRQDVAAARYRRQPAVRFADDLRAERRRDRVSRYRAPAQRVHQLHRGDRARADQEPDAAPRVPPQPERRREPGRGRFQLPGARASSGTATRTRGGSRSRG